MAKSDASYSIPFSNQEISNQDSDENSETGDDKDPEWLPPASEKTGRQPASSVTLQQIQKQGFIITAPTLVQNVHHQHNPRKPQKTKQNFYVRAPSHLQFLAQQEKQNPGFVLASPTIQPSVAQQKESDISGLKQKFTLRLSAGQQQKQRQNFQHNPAVSQNPRFVIAAPPPIQKSIPKKQVKESGAAQMYLSSSQTANLQSVNQMFFVPVQGPSQQVVYQNIPSETAVQQQESVITHSQHTAVMESGDENACYMESESSSTSQTIMSQQKETPTTEGKRFRTVSEDEIKQYEQHQSLKKNTKWPPGVYQGAASPGSHVDEQSVGPMLADSEDLPPPEAQSSPITPEKAEKKSQRFYRTTENEMETLFTERQAKNTKKNTTWGIRVFQDADSKNYSVPGSDKDQTPATDEKPRPQEQAKSTKLNTIWGVDLFQGGESEISEGMFEMPATDDEIPPESLSPGEHRRFKSVSEDDIDRYFEARQSASTKRNTAWGMKIFQDWNIEMNGCMMDMENVAVDVLAENLTKFYCEARPKETKKRDSDQDNEIYHKNSLINIRAAINRHLANIHRNVDIVRDKDFKTPNGVLDGMLKERKRMGLLKPVRHKQIICNIDLMKISNYLKNAPRSPIVLRQSVWYSLSIHFLSRKMEFHQHLMKESFEFSSDSSGKFVTIKQNSNEGGLNFDECYGYRMYATGTEDCPVRMLKLLIEKTDPNATQLFNQYSKVAVIYPSETDVWYTAKRLAKRTFFRFLPDICKASKVEANYSPNCLKATAFHFLNDNGLNARDIMSFYRNKNKASLKVSSKQQKALSKSLSAMTHPVHEETVTDDEMTENDWMHQNEDELL